MFTAKTTRACVHAAADLQKLRSIPSFLPHSLSSSLDDISAGNPSEMRSASLTTLTDHS